MEENNLNAESAVDLTGRTLGGYTILRRLGRGGMADVYLARQDSLHRNVALKILKPDLAQDHSYIERFQREARSAARIVQSNIVGVYEVGEIDGLHYIAQEYVIGRNLREYIARHGAVKPVMAINILRQVAMALQKAEQNQVTHRDIKPENIMLSPNGEIKVADFGLARIEDDQNKHLTQIGITMGTPLYMSPEQVEGRTVDIRSDIYSLGVTAFHMLAGFPPFDAENALAIAVKHIKEQPQYLGSLRPDVPEPMIEIIHRMMAKSPVDRPQSATLLLKELKQIQVDEKDWEHLVDSLAIEPMPDSATREDDSRLAATRQLQSIMQGQVEPWYRNPTLWLSIVALTAVGIVVGLTVANRYPLTHPLGDVTTADSEIKKFESAQQQYDHAIQFHPREIEYFNAVIDLHAIDDQDKQSNQTRLYRDRAWERISELHLLNNRYDAAAEIYKRFKNSDYSRRLPIVGSAGLAIANHYRDRHEEAKQEITLVESEVEGVLNQFLLQKFNEVRRSYFQ